MIHQDSRQKKALRIIHCLLKQMAWMRNNREMRCQTWNGRHRGAALLGPGSSLARGPAPWTGCPAPIVSGGQSKDDKKQMEKLASGLFPRAPAPPPPPPPPMNGRLAASSTSELVPQHSLVEARARLQSRSRRAACPPLPFCSGPNLSP